MATAIVTAPMRVKAAKLADLMPTFSRGRSKQTGQPFIVVPASNRMTAHWTAVDGSGCTCLGYQRRGLCTHAIAAKTLADRQDADRTARQTPGAEMPVTPTSHRPCARKCGATLPPESRLNYCDPCFERVSLALANL